MEKNITLKVVLDACVLYPAPLRDLLLYLASQEIYQPKWSAEINDEWVRNLLINRPDLSSTQLQNTVNAMNRAFPEANVEKDSTVIDKLVLPDQDDRHVLATAMKSKSTKIITANIKDFPADYLEQFHIKTQLPDKFICELLDVYPKEGVIAFQKQVKNLKNPPLSKNDVLNSLEKCGLEQSVLKIKELLN